MRNIIALLIILMTSGCTTTALWEDDDRVEKAAFYGVDTKRNKLVIQTTHGYGSKENHYYRFDIEENLTQLFELADSSDTYELTITSTSWDESWKFVEAPITISLLTEPTAKLDDREHDFNAEKFENIQLRLTEMDFEESSSWNNKTQELNYSKTINMTGTRSSRNKYKNIKFKPLNNWDKVRINDQPNVMENAGKVVVTPVTLAIDTVAVVSGAVLFIPAMIILAR